VHYVQRNFMAGQEFVDLYVGNQHLRTWVHERAGTRIHGTTQQAPLHLFREYEQAALLPLPATPFTLLEIRPVTVHPDCHVRIDKSYYSVPHIYQGHTLEAYISERVVEIYQGLDLVSTHPRSRQPGESLALPARASGHTRLEDYPEHKAAYLQRTPQYCRQLAAQVGPSTSQVVDTLLGERPLCRLRSVQAILRLQDMEAACARALHFGEPHYRRIKAILNAALDKEPLPEAAAAPSPQAHRFARAAEEFFAQPEEVAA